MAAAEHIERFDCFGARCSVLVSGSDGQRTAREAALDARRSLQVWHRRFSRFEPGSELSLLNADPRREVPASELMVRLAAAVRVAGELSGGLVDATLIEQIESAGYASDLGEPLPLTSALALAPQRKPAGAAIAAGWREVQARGRGDHGGGGTVTRPPGVKIDGGGLAKGLFADVLADRLARHASFAVECAGDVAIGGAARAKRAVHVESPFDESTLHTYELARTCVATSGIGRRSWLNRRGRPAHHLLDPATGAPAFTGIVQATALAPTALEAEIRAKSALLAGPPAAHLHLPHGGVIVFDDGSHRVIDPRTVVTLRQLSNFVRGHAPSADGRAAA
jgi:thiamine biosynthesis lipoprotein